MFASCSVTHSSSRGGGGGRCSKRHVSNIQPRLRVSGDIGEKRSRHIPDLEGGGELGDLEESERGDVVDERVDLRGACTVHDRLHHQWIQGETKAVSYCHSKHNTSHHHTTIIIIIIITNQPSTVGARPVRRMHCAREFNEKQRVTWPYRGSARGRARMAVRMADILLMSELVR